ncbi:MAG: ferrous iron transport protein A [Bacteroidetes bacterium]|nr:ferrous iron transport protein A [Bacteroidota bacterium]MBK8659068.1 ferrous iron transport protein A [Bacteroidota bacterium]
MNHPLDCLHLSLDGMKPLDKMRAGERAYIIDIANHKLCEKLFEMGVFPGDMVEMRENADDHNSIVVQVNNQTLNIFRKAAEKIITNTVSFEVSLN